MWSSREHVLPCPTEFRSFHMTCFGQWDPHESNGAGEGLTDFMTELAPCTPVHVTPSQTSLVWSLVQVGWETHGFDLETIHNAKPTTAHGKQPRSVKPHLNHRWRNKHLLQKSAGWDGCA